MQQFIPRIYTPETLLRSITDAKVAVVSIKSTFAGELAHAFVALRSNKLMPSPAHNNSAVLCHRDITQNDWYLVQRVLHSTIKSRP